MKRVIAPSALVLALAAAAAADEVLLRSGGRFVADVIERRADALVLDVDGGQITVPNDHVLRIVPGPTPASRFRERAAALAGGDLQGWLALALWAREEKLEEPARRSFEHVLTLDPDNARAHEAMGRVKLGNRWVTLDESYRARGYVDFEGRWMRPAERDALIREREAEAELERVARAQAAAEAAARAADARARQAEAQAQEAIARARAAEAEAARQRAQAEDWQRRRRRWAASCHAIKPPCGRVVHGPHRRPCTPCGH
jgi:hypothetical protein